MSTATFTVFGRLPSKTGCVFNKLSLSVNLNGAATCGSVSYYYTCLFLGKNNLGTS